MTAAPLLNASLGVQLTPRPGRVFVLVDPPKTRSEGGVWYTDEGRPLCSEGEIFGVGEGVGLDVRFGDRVAILPSTGASLAVSAPHLGFPDELLECDAGDILAKVDPAYPEILWRKRRPHQDPYKANLGWYDNIWSTLDDWQLPKDSVAHRYAPIPYHVLIRPYSPQGIHVGGLITQKNEKWPRIWAWVLRMPVDLCSEQPDVRPGRMVIYARYADEVLGYDTAKDGRKLPVHIVPVSEIKAVVWDPVPVAPEYE